MRRYRTSPLERFSRLMTRMQSQQLAGVPKHDLSYAIDPSLFRTNLNPLAPAVRCPNVE